MPTAYFDSDAFGDDGWQVALSQSVSVHVATRLDEVEQVIDRADRAAHEGHWAAVAVSFEAAAAFESALAPPRAVVPGLPLAWVGIFARGIDPNKSAGSFDDPPGYRPPAFTPTISRSQFTARVRDVERYIRAGDTYQVNLTFPMRADAAPDPSAWYDSLRTAQRARYCAYLDFGRHTVLSLSPELFFARRGERVTARPMKGTSRRGRWQVEDEALARDLLASAKARAENVMIADLLRNDIGRVAVTGSVRVPALCTTERYPTLWQLTSTVEGEVPASTTLVDLFRALFPCGSVTGAPKIRTMEIIASLESAPRGMYTGAIGIVRPGGDCTFNVAIRTLVIDRDTGAVTMGVGAGITADSQPDAEYDESLLKGAFAAGPMVTIADVGPFSLLETMRLDDGRLMRLDRHLERAADAARFFGIEWNSARVAAACEVAVREHAEGTWRARLLVDRNGLSTVDCMTYTPEGHPRRVAFAVAPIDDGDPFLFNKTTRRSQYEKARRARPDVEDVLLWNARGEVTESTVANVVVEIDGERWTPPVESGLLAGVFRGELLRSGTVRERVLTRAAVEGAQRLWLVNSLREWMDVVLVR